MWTGIKKLKGWANGERPAEAQDPAPEDPTVSLRILMVCTGNICRSPTAHGVLRHKLRHAGLRTVAVDSAGTHGYHTSEPPDPRAIAAAARRGYDLSDLQARPLVDEDLVRFDWILAMDQSHMNWLHKRLPASEAERAGLFMASARRFAGVQEVPDPYYGGPAGFERVLDLVEDACDGLVTRLLAESRRL
jgi:protein-tyrosine phosphatase